MQSIIDSSAAPHGTPSFGEAILLDLGGLRVRAMTWSPLHHAVLGVYDNTRDVQVLFDQGDHLISGTACKDKSWSSQFFNDVIVHVP